MFDDIIITLSENKAELVGEFIEDINISPEFSLSSATASALTEPA